MQRAAEDHQKAIVKAQAEVDAAGQAFQDERSKRFAKLRGDLASAAKAVGSFATTAITGAAALGGAIQLAANFGAAAVTAVKAVAGVAPLAVAGLFAMVGVMTTLKLGADGMKAAFKGVFDPLKKSVSDAFEHSLAPAADNLRATLPKLTSGFQQIASALSGVVVKATSFLRTTKGTKEVNDILSGTAKVVQNVGKFLDPVIQAFVRIGQVAMPVLVQLTGNLGKVGDRFNAFIQAAASDGRLKGWIEDGIAGFKQFFGTIKDLATIVGSAFKALTDGAGGVQPILGPAIKTVKDFVQSPEGQETFRTLGHVLAEVGDAVSRILGPALDAVKPLITPFADALAYVAQAAADGLGPALTGLGQALGPLFDALNPVIKILADTLKPLLPLLVKLAAPFVAAIILATPAFLALMIPVQGLTYGLLAMAQALSGDVTGAFQTLKDGGAAELGTLKTITQTDWGQMATDTFNAMSGMQSDAQTYGAGTSTAWTSGLTVMGTNTATTMSGMQSTVGDAFSAMNVAGTTQIGSLAGAARFALDQAAGGGEGAALRLQTAWGAGLNVMGDQTISEGASIAGNATKYFGNGANAVASAGTNASSSWGSAMGQIAGATDSGSSQVTGTLGGLPSRIQSIFGSSDSLLRGIGNSIISGLKAGMSGAMGSLLGFVGTIAGQIAAHKGPLSYDKVVLTPAGQALMSGLHAGLRTGLTPVLAYAGTVAGQIHDAMLSSGLGSGMAVTLAPAVRTVAGATAATGLPRPAGSTVNSSGPQIINATFDLGAGIQQRVQIEIDEHGRQTARNVVAGIGGTR